MAELARCPFCRQTGTLKGLPGHVANQHAKADLPDWVELAPENWQINIGSRQPHAICFRQTQNPHGPPWWWAVIPPETAGRSSRTVAKSGTTQTPEAGREKAWNYWLTYYRPRDPD